MRLKKRRNLKEWGPLSRHHAQRLVMLAEWGEDIFRHLKGAMVLKRGARLYTPSASYIIRPLFEDGQYTGIELKKFGGRISIKMRVVTDGAAATRS